MKSKLSTLGVMLILSGLIFGGCAPITEQPTELPTATPTSAAVEGPDPVRARDAALVYVIGHYGEQAPPRGMPWTEARTTPEGLVGSETFQYTAEDWVVSVSYPVVAPEMMVYQVSVVNRSTGFQWEGEVDAHGTVTELGAEGSEVMFDRVGARDAALNYIYQEYQYPPMDQSVVWEEEDLTPEGLVGAAKYRYTAFNWVVEVSYPIVPPEATIYQVAVTNDHLDFEWQGTIDAQGSVIEEMPSSSGQVVSGEASVESIDILILESFPVQVHVVAKGQLPDACIEIHQIAEQRQGNAFLVTISTVRLPDAKCAPTPVPFEEVIPLDVVGLPADTYTVDVNGVSGSFELEMDNVLPEEQGS